MLGHPPGPPDDRVIQTLKEAYFRQLPKEKFPHTPEITKELNDLETAIKDLRERNRRKLITTNV